MGLVEKHIQGIQDDQARRILEEIVEDMPEISSEDRLDALKRKTKDRGRRKPG